jgi:hypothetical protein
MANKQLINLIAADMGYGHQRAAYPLLDISGGDIITINDYPGIPAWEKDYWVKSLRSYERISRLKKIPLLGEAVFAVMDAFQKIQPFYPYRDLSRPTTQQKYFLSFIKKGLGRDLIEKLNPSGLPFVTTFFVAAYIAEYHDYQGDIYCIICDTDASRAWAPIDPKNSRTKFLVPSEKVRERFLMYGVKSENIFVTGFPLPKENIGGQEKEIAAQDLVRRISALDPDKKYRADYQALWEEIAADFSAPKKQPVTVTFAVGGAGAQKEIGVLILEKLSGLIRSGKINLNLVAGSRNEVNDYFRSALDANGFAAGQGVRIIFAPDKLDYFKKFNECLRQTDILWTKPSELSFYCALGLPIIMSEPVGSQEDFNREWLLAMGAGIDSLDPASVDEWLPDLVGSGRLARAAADGFINAEKMGAYHIEKIVTEK